jgi:hypothetical protein
MVSGTLNSTGVQIEDRFADRLPSDVPYHMAAVRSDERLIGKKARITPLEPSEWPADVRLEVVPLVRPSVTHRVCGSSWFLR